MLTRQYQLDPAYRPKLLYATRQVEQDGQYLKRPIHRHMDCVELMLITEGEGDYIVDGYRYSVCSGDVLLYNMGSLHEITEKKGKHLHTLCFGIASVKLSHLSPGVMTEPENGFVRSSREIPEIRQLSALLYKSAEKEDAVSVSVRSRLLETLLILCINLGSDERAKLPDTNDLLAERIRQYIATHYEEPIDLEQIGERMKTSPYHAAHVFRERIGISPIQYLIRYRMGQAQNLLIRTDLPINQIAAMVGYDNPKHFYEIFREKIGSTPGRYRKAYMESLHGKRTQ